MNSYEEDLKWLVETHKEAKKWGLSDERIKAIARTEGEGILSEKAFEEYMAMEFEEEIPHATH